jgi:hypothetical protein
LTLLGSFGWWNQKEHTELLLTFATDKAALAVSAFAFFLKTFFILSHPKLKFVVPDVIIALMILFLRELGIIGRCLGSNW